MTYLTIAGTEKSACKTGEVEIRIVANQRRRHGQLSWTFGEALQSNEPGARWSELLMEMTTLIKLQGLALALFFHGQPTARFHW